MKLERLAAAAFALFCSAATTLAQERGMPAPVEETARPYMQQLEKCRSSGEAYGCIYVETSFDGF